MRAHAPEQVIQAVQALAQQPYDLHAEIVVRVHEREPELWSIGRMADCLSAGTGSTPVGSAISLREIRPAARTLVSKSRYEGSSPSSPAIASMV
jgi:hypothetical protein